MAHKINWPDALSAQLFLDNYWQKKPLLIRQAFVQFDSPISPDELAGLAIEPDTTPRLVLQAEDGSYHLEHGPFAESRFTDLTDNNWSLLVTDVEKYLPDLSTYLKPFTFLPSWRIDDLMISYAPAGASVGAHVDQYDVFLLQASGSRQWQIDASDYPDLALQTESDLKLVANFNATDTYVLAPGDMLYLPPGVPHHGIADSDNCTTWSIGFRAPTDAEIAMGFAEMLSTSLAGSRYNDPSLTIATPGEISQAVLDVFGARWRSMSQLSKEQLQAFTGMLLTAPANKEHREFYELSDAKNGCWSKHPFSRAAFTGEGETVILYADAVTYPQCSRAFAQIVCSGDDIVSADLSADDKNVLVQLIDAGVLVPVD